MKKTSILSLATATALVATTAGTLAVWDTLDVSKEVTLTYGAPVEVSMNEIVSPTKSLGNGLNGEEEIEFDFTVNVAEYADKTNDKITLTAGGAATSHVDVKFYADGAELTNGVDETIVSTQVYTAKVKLNSAALGAKPTNPSETLSITATLTGDTTNP